ncbi:FAD/NAD(P)-binding domain-containing protein [Annulohypoxylon maeteangense]|uniref:FAD/NAD(P)-binding domain-containing protein n=1 Tax=Annulohypoxylon maeteangense TaxID=1927788 RepID=UPI0020080904|nr:FAD/NAD(P)-binding domain-containing protein [Annulohypoxylon maeteangense]KAI0887621.1 FAD/NAD(P)-binding domain-containing protein [Annulohypoxylon maeteangense]
MPGIFEETPVEIAIVGGGIIGLCLAAGLIKQDVKVKVYEQAQSFREIGAGMAFTANAIRCMGLMNPDIVSALRSGGSVATSLDKNDPNDYLRWTDGYNKRRKDDPSFQPVLYKIDAGYKGFEGTRRDQFLEALVKVIPQEIVELKKRLDTVEEKGSDGRVHLNFTDGTTAVADAVIGCDGIKSRVRELMFGSENPASYPHYTHKVAYRALVPMEKAIQALGEYKARNQHNHVGPNAHLIHYPVANQTMINATAFISDPNEWPDDKVTVMPGLRKDLEESFADWNPCLTALIQFFPEKLEKWAVYDTWDFPAPFFNKGAICLAGDAAHASSPHHGAGACCGIEDALCLVTLIKQVKASLREGSTKKEALDSAFEVYDGIRRTRSQWLVNSSRRVCDLYHQPEWGHEQKWIKAETCFEEIKDRSLKIWHFDYDTMMKKTIEEYAKKQPSKVGVKNGKTNGTVKIDDVVKVDVAVVAN